MAAPMRKMLHGTARSLECPWRLRTLCAAATAAPAAAATPGKSAASPNGGSPWRLLGALCLQRPPVISQPLSPLQVEMAELLEQIEVEKSRYSDHEIRALEEAQRLERKKADIYDSDDDDEKDILLVQDLEDTWEQKFLQFKPEPRVTENSVEAKFLGNAPCGYYKFKFPQAFRTENSIGAKVFFFKALLQSGNLSQARKKNDHAWVSKEELGDYLKPKYLAQVRRFFMDI
ncbi:39S ribosomal protein L46, mitochondrial isoform X2 [Monodelphis domestica]|uniref:39S ribosomal protein L46, mitochondrial isoform X2 n=1 Tax=Monodelphis domestica TaxID=13616 RepID=UPI0024E2405B|nr:39S ribosomal protein L46, mitochondrial isoform X2 [Monodelphis domestica]